MVDLGFWSAPLWAFALILAAITGFLIMLAETSRKAPKCRWCGSRLRPDPLTGRAATTCARCGRDQ